MKTKEEKALEIAKAEGWLFQDINSYWIYPDAKNNKLITIKESKLIELFSSYNGLMPIFFKHYDKIDFCSQFGNVENKWLEVYLSQYSLNDASFNFTTEKEFLDALLDAVYFVLVESKAGE